MTMKALLPFLFSVNTFLSRSRLQPFAHSILTLYRKGQSSDSSDRHCGMVPCSLTHCARIATDLIFLMMKMYFFFP